MWPSGVMFMFCVLPPSLYAGLAVQAAIVPKSDASRVDVFSTLAGAIEPDRRAFPGSAFFDPLLDRFLGELFSAY